MNKFSAPVSNTVAVVLIVFYILVSVGVLINVQDYNL